MSSSVSPREEIYPPVVCRHTVAPITLHAKLSFPEELSSTNYHDSDVLRMSSVEGRTSSPEPTN